MSSRHPSSDPKRPRERRLIALLGRADAALQDLRVRAASICQSGNLGILGFRGEQLEELKALLHRGNQLLDGRIYTLDGSRGRDPVAPQDENFSRNAIVEPITFFASYRGCCRALCAAMKEAVRLEDSTSALLLRDLILKLEKQLWMIDVPDRGRGLDERRAVSLFLSC